MACTVVKTFLEKATVSAIPYGGASPEELAILANNKEPLSREEAQALERAIIREPEPGYLELLSKYLLAGKSPRRILDAFQTASAQVILATQGVNNFSLPQHCFEYLNSMTWFFDHFPHKHQANLLFLAASYLNRAPRHHQHLG